METDREGNGVGIIKYAILCLIFRDKKKMKGTIGPPARSGHPTDVGNASQIGFLTSGCFASPALSGVGLPCGPNQKNTHYLYWGNFEIPRGIVGFCVWKRTIVSVAAARTLGRHSISSRNTLRRQNISQRSSHRDTLLSFYTANILLQEMEFALFYV